MSDILSKFGVFTGLATVSRTFKAPKPKYRFRVDFIGMGDGSSDDLTLEAESVKLPQITFDPQEIHGYNSVAYYAGKPKWSEVDMVVRDTYDNSTSVAIMKQQTKQMDPMQQVTANVPANYKFTTKICALDGHGNTLSTWELAGCFLSSVNYGDFNYKESSANLITMNIRYDNAVLYDALGLVVGEGLNVSTLLTLVGLL